MVLRFTAYRREPGGLLVPGVVAIPRRDDVSVAPRARGRLGNLQARGSGPDHAGRLALPARFLRESVSEW